MNGMDAAKSRLFSVSLLIVSMEEGRTLKDLLQV